MNIVDLGIILILIALIALAIGYLIKSKKRGKLITRCSGDCSNCLVHECKKLEQEARLRK